MLPLKSELLIAASDDARPYLPPSVTLSRALISSAALEVSPYAFASSLCKLRKLTPTRVNDGLDLLFRLLANRHHAIKVLIHEQANKHLKRTAVLF